MQSRLGLHSQPKLIFSYHFGMIHLKPPHIFLIFFRQLCYKIGLLIYGLLQTSRLNFLKVFGLECQPNIRLYNHHKLSFYSISCLFLSYSSSYKGSNVLINITIVFIFHGLLFSMKTTFPTKCPILFTLSMSLVYEMPHSHAFLTSFLAQYHFFLLAPQVILLIHSSPHTLNQLFPHLLSKPSPFLYHLPP